MAPLLFSLRRSRQLHRQVSKLTQSDIPVYYALNQKTSLQFSAYCPAKEAKRHFNSSSKSPQHPGRLENSTCMITGASSGIGFAIAERMLQEGAEKVILVGRSSERLDNALQRLGQSIVPRPVSTNSGIEPEKVAEGTETNPFATQSGEWGSFYSKLKGQTASQTGVKAGQSSIHREAGVKSSSASAQVIKMSSRVSVMVGDVGDSSFWSGDVKKSMNNVDILVNAAGVSFSSLLPFAKDDAIAEMLRTNLQGTIFACRAMVSPLLRRPPSGKDVTPKCIINISSLHAIKGGIGAATYASTKAGVIALTRAVAAEASTSRHGARVRANVIVPGYIETKMLTELSPQVLEQAKSSVPLRRFGTCEEVADAAIFLATNQYANNCILNLDGGLSAL